MFHVKLKNFYKMKTQFFDIEDLKTKPLSFWSNFLSHDSDGFSGNIYFASCDARLYRVSFSSSYCMYCAEFYYYRARTSFNKRIAMSFRELLEKVYELLYD